MADINFIGYPEATVMANINFIVFEAAIANTNSIGCLVSAMASITTDHLEADINFTDPLVKACIEAINRVVHTTILEASITLEASTSESNHVLDLGEGKDLLDCSSLALDHLILVPYKEATKDLIQLFLKALVA